MQFLLDRGADIEYKAGKFDTTPLMHAARQGNDDVIQVRSEASESALMFVLRCCSTTMPTLTLWMWRVTQRFTMPQLMVNMSPLR